MLVSFLNYAQHESLPAPEAGFSAIIVNDIERSIHWYSNIFEFSVLNTVNSKERGLKQANLKLENIRIELIELASSISPESLLKNYPKKTKIKGFFKFGFSVAEFDKWVDFLKRSKVAFHGNIVKDNASGKKMLIIKDPDGNRIQLFEK